MIKNEIVTGHEIFDYFYQSKIPLHDSIHFLTPFGSFQISLLHSKIRHQSNGIFIDADIHILFKNLTNRKHNFFDISHILDMRLLDTKLDKNVEKIIHIHGFSNEENTYTELSQFIQSIFKLKKCHYCKNIYLENSPDEGLCIACHVLDKNAKIIQNATRNAFYNPKYFLCKQRLKKEFEELNNYFVLQKM